MTDIKADVPKKPHGKINKWWLIGGGIAAATVYYVYKKNSAASTAVASTATSGDAIDPSTGLSYAEEDGLDYTAVGSPYSNLTSSAPIGSLGSFGTAGSTPLTNQSYAQNINDYLVNVLGYSQSLVSSSLGKWLSGSGTALTSQESAVVQAAQAYGGAPPVSVPTPNYTTNDGQSGSTTSGNNVPYSTGNLYQDTVQSLDPYAQAAYAAWKANPSSQTQQAYFDAVNEYQAQNPTFSVPGTTAGSTVQHG